MIVPEERVRLGIIGGSGFYDPDFLSRTKEIKVYTPYGEPSDMITVGEVEGVKVAFIPRHGRGHRVPPHRINYRANVWALHQLGAKWVVSVSAVGSLREDYRPGDFVVPDQFIDMTKGRSYTFFDGPVVAHVSMADPFCEHLRQLLIEAGKAMKLQIREKGTYLCIEGPRFSTRAESRVWREVFKADLVGMTLVPEVNLACEAGLCYASLAGITDYDVFAEKPVTVEQVENVMKDNTQKAKEILRVLVRELPPEPERCGCCASLKNSTI
ncbi:S-methyl-5'-thioadenosine phosphorylase [Sulfodiicoccus acidiphilus]|uniref:S-methyl-5'-thioadenosine phosphorylase n=1 Tax=Sulfodiicoccus acidiphilus TaxID=1670455 RepID=A0A348B3Z9_9CREN|nr:S-methyl-5'-thioadenosine phosphorylase [Sulfodiicoccus acidiphilus]BBD72901.1 S-methyl-5'-thioadenosine phosphorylase [Sulfodiicoccus acidiphilus]GGT88142.1 S-methyl-5'-thioadenosine phosphorylase [Sulfodiicoccus acidiphilus]